MLDKDGNGFVDRKELEDILKRTFIFLSIIFLENGMVDLNGKSID
jgi:hypothetical protein